MKRLSLSVLLPLTVFAGKAQPADTSYQLLWYKGRKIKENVLLTPFGDTVFFNSSNGTVRKSSNSGPGKKFDDMLAEVHKTNQRINQMLQTISASLPRQVVPYYAAPLKEAYAETEETCDRMLSNTMDVPEFSNSVATTFGGRGPSIFPDGETDDATEKAISDIQAYMQQHAGDPIDDLPVPPMKDLRYCAQCDKQAKENYRKACIEFEKKMWGEEGEVMRKIFSLEHYTQLEAEKKPVIAGSGEYAQSVSDRLEPVRDFLMRRLLQKTRNLVEKYKDDPFRAEEVCVMALGLERQRQILGKGEPKKLSIPMVSPFTSKIRARNLLTWACLPVR